MFGKLRYPSKVLPKKNYKRKINVPDVLDNCDLIILRRSDYNKEDTFNQLGHVREDAILLERVPRLSMNISGTFFKDEHLKFIIDKRGAESWQGDEIFLLDYYRSYRTASVFTPIFFRASDLHGAPIPFSIDKTNPAGKKLAHALNMKDEKNQSEFSFVGNSMILHSPTNMNYWHIELCLYDQTNSEIVKVKNIISQKAAGYMLSHILCVKGKDKPEFIAAPIAQSFYHDN